MKRSCNRVRKRGGGGTCTPTSEEAPTVYPRLARCCDSGDKEVLKLPVVSSFVLQQLSSAILPGPT